jgi:thermostable 8-oxoguanine DNA glycosylase
MNRITRLINSNCTHTPAPMWKAFSFCTAMAITAVIGFTTVAITNPAAAQDRTTEADQDRSTDDQFPSKESMDEGVNAEVKQGNLTEMQATAIMRVYARLAMGLENKKLSESEAITILDERTKAIYEQKQGQPEITRKDYADAQAAMQKMVDAGEMSKEQMDARLIQMRQMIGRSQPQITRKDYADAQAAMQKMVDVGEMSKEQMDARLIQMRQMIGRSQPQITRKDYADAVVKMTAMVKSGEITREQMQQRLDRMKAAMTKQSDSKITRKDYADAQAAMQKMVNAGEMSKEQMDARLIEMRQMIGRSKSQSTRKDYADAVAKMNAMVKSGEITSEQMQQRLEAMRSKGPQGGQ